MRDNKIIFPKNKTGSHVGMMISFMIFITFVVFLIAIFWPSLNINSGKSGILEGTKINLLNYLSSDLTTISVRIKDGENLVKNCVDFQQLTALNETGLSGSNMAVKKADDSSLGFEYKESTSILGISSDKTNRFFKIYASQGISATEGTYSSCDILTTNDYDVGIVRKESRIFQKKIIDAISLYNINYQTIKQDAGISSGEFSFDFIYENGTLIRTREAPLGIDISTERVSIDYLDANLNLHSGDIVVKVW
jgi:hypothetical protein